MSVLRDTAYKQYSLLADDIVANRFTDIKEIEKVMDGLCDFGDEARFIDLYRKVCKHVYYNYPALVGEHISLFRAQWMTNDDAPE